MSAKQLVILIGTLLLAGVLVLPQFCAARDLPPYVLDMSPGWNMCAQRCQQDDEFGILTRKGCLAGCEIAKGALPHPGFHYRDISGCRHEIESLDVTEHIEALQKVCKSRWDHIYKRRGCMDAVKEFYSQWSTELCVMQNSVSPGGLDAIVQNRTNTSNGSEVVKKAPHSAVARPRISKE